MAPEKGPRAKEACDGNSDADNGGEPTGGRPALRSIMPLCTSIAQRTASTTLRNSIRLPSPVRLTMRP
jgi:hypothetical protein